MASGGGRRMKTDLSGGGYLKVVLSKTKQKSVRKNEAKALLGLHKLYQQYQV